MTSVIGATQFDDLFFQYAAFWGVPYTWVKAVAGAESDYNPNAYRNEPYINDASRGLMQILFKTATGLGYLGSEDGLYDPETNINLGSKLLAENIRRYGENFERVYSAYNSGRPDLYKTSAEVKAHVDRAVSYLRAVENGLEQTSTTGQAPDTSQPEEESGLEPG